MEIKEFETKIKENINIEISNDKIKRMYDFMKMVLQKNEVMNLTNITEENEFVVKHIIDSLTIYKHIKQNDKVIDVGTGAGFPGIPLKIMKPQTEITLLDSLNKRINFLSEATELLKLKDIELVHSRAEELGQNIKYREKYDVAVSRAVAPLNILVEYMLPLVKIGGTCICMKGSNAQEEIENSKKAINFLGGNIEKIEEFNLATTDNKRTIIVIKKERNTPKDFPRKAGTPKKEPI